MSALATRVQRWLPGGRWLVIVPPYVWMLLFFAAPFAIVLKISFAKSQIAIPPYTDLLQFSNNLLQLVLNLDP